ncbi:glycosyltransferase [Mucilaginibacter sp. UR6-11]|uniref:glycosyltransferase n=1 Tax=Mucilaginibacter sp. UR6-11 TaxID=1435644 RepID=UPI001E43482F|nr:glycosyltransferase [Mucilaginibacter sp. UR6-11]MCC8427172.1 glycosyltransferase [Mucilaginibacter sp. UR6-11]
MRKTLIIVTPGFPENEQDTACLPDRQIFVRVLKETYPELNIVVLSFQYPDQPRQYSWNGVQVIALGGKNKSGLYRRITWISAWQKLKKLNETHKVIGLLSFWLDECAFIGDKFSRSYKLKHYSWLLGQDARPGNKYVYRMMPSGESLIALSDFIVTEFKRNYGVTPKYLVPGAVDPAVFKTYTGDRDIDIIGAGSLINLKQYAVFVDMIFELKKDFPAIKAVICGKGPEMRRLQDKIRQLGLENNLELKGELPHAEVLTLMQRAKVFLHTSKYEGFGIVCLEALGAGAKVVSFVQPMNTGIPNWHIAKNARDMQHITTGLLRADEDYQPVLPYRADDAARAIMQLFDQQELAMS